MADQDWRRCQTFDDLLEVVDDCTEGEHAEAFRNVRPQLSRPSVMERPRRCARLVASRLRPLNPGIPPHPVHVHPVHEDDGRLCAHEGLLRAAVERVFDFAGDAGGHAEAGSYQSLELTRHLHEHPRQDRPRSLQLERTFCGRRCRRVGCGAGSPRSTCSRGLPRRSQLWLRSSPSRPPDGSRDTDRRPGTPSAS